LNFFFPKKKKVKLEKDLKNETSSKENFEIKLQQVKTQIEDVKKEIQSIYFHFIYFYFQIIS